MAYDTTQSLTLKIVRLIFGLTLILTSCTPTFLHERPQALDAIVSLDVPKEQSIKLVVMGDQGTKTLTQARVAQAMHKICQAQGCHLGLGLGDSFYPAGPQYPDDRMFKTHFEDYYKPLKIPFLMTLGNHDLSWLIDGDGADPAGAKAQILYAQSNPQFIMPARSYRAVIGNLAEIFVLDTVPLASYFPSIAPHEQPNKIYDQQQRRWLKNQLTQSKAQWRLVAGHHPLFSNGKHGDAGHYDQWPFSLQRGDAVRNLYQLACGKANLILSGHDHSLQLFAPQPSCPNTWSLVSGAAGKANTPKKGKRKALFEIYKQPGFMWLEITRKQLHIQIFAVDRKGNTQRIHTHTLNKKSMNQNQ